MKPTFTRSFEASAAIAGARIVVFSDVAASARVAQAAAATTPAIGVSDVMGAPIGGMCDVHMGGEVPLQLGGTVTAGAPLMSDANACGIAATAAAATTRRVIGYALEPGVAGDIIKVWLAQGLLDRG